MTSDVNLFESLNFDDPVETPNEPQEAPVSQEQLQGIEAQQPTTQEEITEFSKGEGFKHAFRHETLMGYGVKSLLEQEFEPDPEFHPTLGFYEENFADIPADLHEHLYDAESQAELDYKADQLRERLVQEQRFDAMGTPDQIGLLVAATIADAPAMALATVAGAVTGGATTAAVGTRLGITGTRIARVVGGAAGVATEAAIQEAILASKDPLKNEQTVMLAGLMGLGFGTVGSGIGQSVVARQVNKAAKKDAKNLGDRLIREAAQEVAGTKKPQRTFNDVIESTTANVPNALDELYKGVPTSDAGALRNVGIDMTSQLKRSKDPEFQRMGNILGEDGPYGGGATMALEFDVTTRPVLADGLAGIEDGYKAWTKENNIGYVHRSFHKGRQAFDEEVALVARNVKKSDSPAVNKAAKASQKFFKEMLDVAKKSGVKGFDDIATDLNYVTRQYDSNSFRRVTQQYGADAEKIIKRTIVGAIKAADNEFDDEIAGLIAKGIHRRSMSTAIAPDQKFTTIVTNDFKEELMGILEDAGTDAKKIEEILNRLTKKSDKGLDVSKRRINMEEGFVDSESGLAFTDLLENNIEQIMTRYARSVGGASAAAKFGFETPDSLIRHLEKTADKALASGTLSEGQAKAMRRKSINLANQILGRPNEEHGAFAKVAQTLMDYNYIANSGGFALASLPEMMITTAENGLAATLKHVPMANKFIKDIRDGIPPDQDLLNVLGSFGVGRDWDMMNAFVRIAEDDALNSVSNKGIQALNAGKRIASKASGLPQLTRFSQLVAGKSTIQKFADMAVSGKPVKMKQWIRQLGFEDETQLQNMFTGLKKYSKTQPGIVKGQKVVGLDFDGWMAEDPAAATQFMYAVARRVNHQIQRNLPGELPEFMSKTWGRLVMQFKTFGLAAYGKKTLNALARRDLESMVAVGYTTTAAAMIYAARMYALSFTRDDPERFLQERLSPKNMVKAAIQRSGYASILPTMIDNGIGITKPIHGQDRIFNDFARTSGLDVGGLKSVPAVGVGDSLIKGAAIPRKLITGQPVEEKDVRGLVNATPLHRLPGINMGYEYMINAFPERGRDR